MTDERTAKGFLALGRLAIVGVSADPQHRIHRAARRANHSLARTPA